MAQPAGPELSVLPSWVDVVRFGPEDVEAVWPSVEGFLERAFATTKKLDSADAYCMAMGGEVQLWVGFGQEGLVGAALTAIETYTNGYRVVTFLAMGGEGFKKWDRQLLGAVEAFGKENGCDAVEIQGRKGWGRWFPEFEPTSWYYAKEL